MADNNIDIQINVNTETGEIETLAQTLHDVKASADETSDSLSQMGDETASSVDSADQSVQQLGDDVDNVQPGPLEETANGADQLGDSADNADEKIRQIGDDVDLISSASMLSIAGEIDQIGAKSENMAQEMNTAAISVGQLATQTGVAEPQMVSLINNISNATFPNEEAMMYVKSLDQMGVATSNLGTSATNLDRINDAFGLGAQKTNSLGQELGVLGVDMNNVESSFNALAYANANTVGGMDNYYTFLRKYDSQFKELGFNVDQASVIIAAATQKFGGGRAALTGLSDALKESNGDTRKLEEALGMEAGSLDNATQLTGEYEGQLQQLAQEEADHKSVLDQAGAAWEDLSLSISGVASPLAGVFGMVGQFGSFYLGAEGIYKFIKAAKGLSIVEGISKMLDLLSLSNIREAITSMAAVAPKIANAAATWALAIASWALSLPLILIVAVIIAVIAILWYLYNTNETVRNGINWLYQQLVKTVAFVITIPGYIRAMVTAAVASFLAFRARVIAVFNAIITAVVAWGTNVVSTALNAVNNLKNTIVNGIRAIPSAIQSALSSLANIIFKPFQDAWNKIKPIIDTIKNAVGTVTGWMGDNEVGFYSDADGFSTASPKGNLNRSLSAVAASSSKTRTTSVNNNFYGLIEESAADYIVSAVNDRIRKENIMRGI